MHKDENLDCKVLSVMMRHLNILKYFSFVESLGLFTFNWNFIDSDHWKVSTLKVKGFHQIMQSNPQVNLFNINSIEIIHAPRESG